jgi:Flp pilus assembly protein TadG
MLLRRRQAHRAAPERAAPSERGGAAIEFALVFPLFFFLFYSLVHYGLIFALYVSMTDAAREAARASVAADPRDASYEILVSTRARSAAQAALAWLPSAQKELLLGTEGSNVEVAVEADAALGTIVRVELTYPDYSAHSLLPMLTLPGLGPVPPVPSHLHCKAIAQL